MAGILTPVPCVSEALGMGAASNGINFTTTTDVEITAATVYDRCGLWITMTGREASDTRVATLGIGAAAAERPLMEIYLTFSNVALTPGLSFFAPVRVPAGSRLAAKSSAASSSIDIHLNGLALGGAANMGSDFVESAGVSGDGGTDVNAGASANTKGAWAEMSASTVYRWGAIMVIIGNNANAAMSTGDFRLDIGVGAAGSEQVIHGDFIFTEELTYDRLNNLVFGPFPCDIPIGSRIAVRVQSTLTDATDRIIDAIVLGFAA